MELSRKCIRQLRDLESFLHCINEDLYKESIPELSGATMGQHTRHILEFYTCLVSASEQEPVVCYDNRARNPLIENQIPAAIQEIREISKALEERTTDFVLTQETLNEGADALMIKSSFQRELWYVYEHTTHHMAILKIGALLKNVTNLPQNFGVADSTISYRKEQESV